MTSSLRGAVGAIEKKYKKKIHSQGTYFSSEAGRARVTADGQNIAITACGRPLGIPNVFTNN